MMRILFHNLKMKIYSIKLGRILGFLKQVGNNAFIASGYKLKGLEYISIGNNFYAGPNCRIEAWDSYGDKKFYPQLIFGDNVKINSQCHIGCINKITIGNNCLLGSYVFITDHSHGNSNSDDICLHPIERPLFSKGSVVIEDDCWLCESCVILPNVCVGHHSIIGAHAVVTSNVPPYSVVVGNPGKVVKTLR